MAAARPSLPSIERTFAWAPIDDPVRNRALDPGTIYNAGRPWTAFGLTALGHTVGVNVATGGLTISSTDLSFPYHSMRLDSIRSLDAQEQYSQFSYLDSHANTDPRLHFFGNWQFQREALISPAWKTTLADFLVSGGDGSATLLYRDYPDFEVNATAGPSIESRLRKYGVPGRTLAAVGWQNAAFDCFLRTRQGAFGILAGHFDRETMVDSADLRLLVVDPTTGTARKYSSEYGYHELIDTDGLREANVPILLTDVVDALGHLISFRPTAALPPFRSYRLTDGSGRSFLFEMGASVKFRDGEFPGGMAKSYLVSRVTDQITADNNFIEYRYDGYLLIEVEYPAQAGGSRRTVSYEYDDRANLISIRDPIGDVIRF